jgi:pyrroloquinoline-quinone synthase
MDLVDRIDALIDERHLLTHSFYRKWVDGTLPPDALQEYARQYYAFESNFPRFLSALHSRTEDPAIRAGLLENLWDEEHGESNHRELWLRFAEGIGVDRDDVTSARWNDATRGLVATYEEATREAPVAAGVAALYAYERQVPPVAQAKLDGLKARFGVTDPRTLGFFQTHAWLDVEHSNAEREMIASLSDGVQDEVLATTAAALDAWWSFLDAVDPAEDRAA